MSSLYALLGCFLLVFVAHGQDQSGFISLDCGLMPDNSSYTEPLTGIKYISDSSYIATGISKSVSPEYKTDMMRNMWFVRTFPYGTRNCYNLKVEKNSRYLIRATFMYGNYDSIMAVPEFDLHLGPNKWETVKVELVSSNTTAEIIHAVSTTSLQICLVNTGRGTPFISALEIRLLNATIYEAESGSLVLLTRLNLGTGMSQTVRYQDDVYDRIWQPFLSATFKQLSTIKTVDSGGTNSFEVPNTVMKTAAMPQNLSGSIILTLNNENITQQLYVYMHFAEIQELQANELREFEILLNGENWFGPFSPDYLSTSTVYSVSPLSGKSFQFSIHKTENSTLPPILNALEIYFVNELPQFPTNETDVDSISGVKSMYGVKKNWQGDPCVPRAYSWEGLRCSYHNTDPPQIISLDLNSSGLTGDISQYISTFTQLQYLDLSNNSLTGPVPDLLSQLQFLRVLNLSDNHLNGSVPPELLKRAQTNSLSLSLGGNPGLCTSMSCPAETKPKSKEEKHDSSLVLAIVIAASCLVLVTALAVVFVIIKRKKTQVRAPLETSVEMTRHVESAETNNDDSLEVKNQKFTYLQILNITSNFERAVGTKGAFGTLYHGYFQSNPVVVKMLSQSSLHDHRQFHAEVKHLFRVHHRNLSSLVGYCNEGNNKGLVYEYMPNGNLRQHLSENSSAIVISWENRLRIAIDVAQGLEYLQHGCKPTIIHRNVKSSNIFLDENFCAKLGGFGLSRDLPADEGTHVYTVVAGTPGYVDPEYYQSNRLTEKSDVYSFGVVLLEIITSQPAIIKTRKRMHISQWVNSMLDRGDIGSIVDKRLHGDFDIDSMKKTLEVAMACLSESSSSRPGMSDVVTQLRECLAIETARKRRVDETELNHSIEMATANFGTGPNHPTM